MTLPITLQHHTIAVNGHQSIPSHTVTEAIAVTIQQRLLGAPPLHQALQTRQCSGLLRHGSIPAQTLQRLSRILQRFGRRPDAATGQADC